MTERQQIYDGFFALLDKKADPIKISAAWGSFDISLIYRLLLNMLRDMLRYKLFSAKATLINSDFYALFASLSAKIPLNNLLSYWDMVQKEYKNFIISQSLNKQLLLEELLIRWVYVSR
jgi:hypothetical protein